MTIRITIVLFSIFIIVFPGARTALAQKQYGHATGFWLYELRPDELIADTSVFDLLSAYKDSMSLKMQEIIVENKVPLSKAQPECTLGNWISDAAKNNLSRQGTKVDACLFSYGCIGKEYLAPGPVHRKDFYELIPFENKMILISVSGTVLNQLCDSIARVNGLPVSGLSFTIDSGKALNVMIGKRPLNEHLVYTLLINDYLLSRYKLLLGSLHYQQTGLYLRNLLLQESAWLHNNGLSVQPILENRIIYAE